MIIVTDLSHPFLTDFVFIREGFLFIFFVMVCIFGATHLFFSPDYVDSQRDLFYPAHRQKRKCFITNGTAAYFTHHV